MKKSGKIQSMAIGVMLLLATGLLASGCAVSSAQSDDLEILVERAENAAIRAEQAADRAEKMAEKSERIFNQKMKK